MIIILIGVENVHSTKTIRSTVFCKRRFLYSMHLHVRLWVFLFLNGNIIKYIFHLKEVLNIFVDWCESVICGT